MKFLKSFDRLTWGLIAMLAIFIITGLIFLYSKVAPKSDTPIVSPSAQATPSPTENPSPSETPKSTKTPTPKPKATPTRSPSPKPTPTRSPSPTPNPTATSSPNPAVKVVNLLMEKSSQTSLNVGQMVTISLKMDTGSDQVTAAEIRLNFDHTKIELQSFTAGSFLPIVLEAESHDNNAGTVTFSLGSLPSTPASGTGTLATITFKALSGGSASVNYSDTTQTASAGRTGNSLNTTSNSTVTINP